MIINEQNFSQQEGNHMESVKKFVIILVAILLNQTANAKALKVEKIESLGTHGSGFTAPNVAATTSIPNPDSGDIIFNTADGTFYGSNGSTWTALGGASAVPTGTISAYAGTSAPAGYLLCDGSAVSRSTYAALFAIISTAYGVGNGSTTFNLPDFRGLFLRGLDGAAGRDPNSGTRTALNGGNTGNNLGSYQSHAFQDHMHSYDIRNGAGGGSAPPPGNATAYTSGTTAGASGNVSTETRPSNVYVNYIIKL